MVPVFQLRLKANHLSILLTVITQPRLYTTHFQLMFLLHSSNPHLK